jgi:hypothetical protein
MLAELPLVEMPSRTSPRLPNASTWRAKMPSTPKSFPIAVRSDVSVVSAIARIAGRGWSSVKVLTNSVARCCASAALPPLPQISSVPSARNDAVIRAAASTMSSRQASTTERIRSDVSVRYVLARRAASSRSNVILLRRLPASARATR